MKIRFSDFWSDFDPTDSMVGDWCKLAFGSFDLSEDPKKNVDLEISSVFPFPTKLSRLKAIAGKSFFRERRLSYAQSFFYGVPFIERPAVHRVWYTGENIRAPHGYDLTISFDIDDYGGSNVYAPFWLDRISFSETPLSTRRVVSASELMNPRSTDISDRKFCAVIMSNPHPLRIRAVAALRSIGAVDIFGRSFGRPVEDKHEVLRQYKFCLAFENDLYPGYVTEKVVDAWTAGCVPLWWGSDPLHYLNRGSLINLADYSTMADFVSAVGTLNSNPRTLQAIAERPLLARMYDHLPIIEKLRSFT